MNNKLIEFKAKAKQYVEEYKVEIVIFAGVVATSVIAATATAIAMKRDERRRHAQHWSCIAISEDDWKNMYEGGSSLYKLGGDDYVLHRLPHCPWEFQH